MFKAFPEFTKLNLINRHEYESLIAAYPPISDITFISLVSWWNEIGEIAVSLLNGNLIISYWLPGDEAHTGLSLVGTERIDETICALFDHLQEAGQPVKLVSVPEFVIDHIQYPELYSFISARGNDEYIVPLSRFSPVENMAAYPRVKTRKFMRINGRQNLSVRSLDLHRASNRALYLDAVKNWPKRGLNALTTSAIIKKNIVNAAPLGISNICIFVGDKPVAFCLYHAPYDKEYVILDHVRVNYDVPHIFDYMTHAFAEEFLRQGFKYANLNPDMDAARLRVIKILLRPSNFFRKYTISPSSQTIPLHTLERES